MAGLAVVINQFTGVFDLLRGQKASLKLGQ